MSNYWTKYLGRKTSRRRVLAGGGAAAIGTAALLAGCGDDDAPAAAAAATTKAAAATEAAGDRSRYGGTFNYMYPGGSEPTGYDPGITITYAPMSSLTYSQAMMYSVAENTFWGDSATSWEQTDPETLVLKVRDGMKWNPTAAEASGDRFITSEDFKFSYQRLPDCRQNRGSNVNQTFFGWMTEGGASIDTPDANTLTIHQKAPFASNLHTLAANPMAIVNPEMVEANGGDLGAVQNGGAGPYVFSDVRNTGMSFERNPNYYAHEGVGRFNKDFPYIDAYEDVIIQDLGTRESRFLAGDSDYFGGIDRIKASEWEDQPNVNILEGPANEHSMMQLNPPAWLPYPELRKAMWKAIDFQGYIDVVLGGEGVLGSPVAPGFPAVLSQEELAGYQQYDPEGARALWEANGGNEIFDGKIVTVTPAWADPVATTFLGAQIEKALGVEVEYRPLDIAAYIASANGHVGMKEWDFFIASNGSLNTSPFWNGLMGYTPDSYGAIWGGLWYKGSLIAEPYEDSSHPNYVDDDEVRNKVLAGLELTHDRAKYIQDLVDDASGTLDVEAQNEKLRFIQRDVLDFQCCTIPLPVQSIEYVAVSNRVKGLPPVPDTDLGAAGGILRAQNYWLEG
jgi:ABC-type transport system substrate-binding protein